MGTFLGTMEIMLLSFIGAFFGSLFEDIVIEFANQDKILAMIEDASDDEEDIFCSSSY